MQEKWDHIDQSISKTLEEIIPSEDYNEILMRKLHGQRKDTSRKYISGMSFITAGILMMLILTTGIQYKVAETKFKIKAEVMTIQYKYNHSLDILKFFIRE